MPEILNVKVRSSGETTTITDSPTLESAVLFKALSDKILQTNNDSDQVMQRAPVTLTPKLAGHVVARFVGGISEDLTIVGRETPLRINGTWPGAFVTITPETMAQPVGASIGTFKWDARNDWRPTVIDGRTEAVDFIDGHRDYYRELFLELSFGGEDLDQQFSAKYCSQRYQPGHNELTKLDLSVRSPAFDEMGYGGQHVYAQTLSERQERRFVDVISELGGLSVA